MTTDNKASVIQPTENPPEQSGSPFPKEIFNLVPHVIEDYCRLRRRLKRKRTKIDRLWSSKKPKYDRNKIVDPYKRKIEVKVRKKLTPSPSKRQLSKNTGTSDSQNKQTKNINKLSVKKKEALKNQGCRQSCLSAQLTSKEKGVSEDSNIIEIGFQKQQQTMTKQMKALEYARRVNTRNHIAPQNLKKRICRPRDFLRNSLHNQKESSCKDFYNRLSKPKSFSSPAATPWKLTKSMQNFKPSERLVQMAQPKLKASPCCSLSEVLKVKKAALHYKASHRIMELALPVIVPEMEERDPYHVSERALNARISDRIAELAHPKNRSDRTSRKYPFKVPRRALYAKASKHIKELAQPKHIVTRVIQ